MYDASIINAYSSYPFGITCMIWGFIVFVSDHWPLPIHQLLSTQQPTVDTYFCADYIEFGKGS